MRRPRRRRPPPASELATELASELATEVASLLLLPELRLLLLLRDRRLRRWRRRGTSSRAMTTPWRGSTLNATAGDSSMAAMLSPSCSTCGTCGLPVVTALPLDAGRASDALERCLTMSLVLSCRRCSCNALSASPDLRRSRLGRRRTETTELPSELRDDLRAWCAGLFLGFASLLLFST